MGTAGAEIDIDENPNTPRDYQVMSIPTLILFRGGKPVKQIVGAKPKAALLSGLAGVL
jgi:thioredoxin 1